jgi:uridylate kinase
LRATEIQAEAVLKGTQVDGVYTADPKTDPEATLLPEVSYQDALTKRLKIMDSTAFSLCMDNRMPIHVFNMHTPGTLLRVVKGEKVGSVVR